MTKPDDGAVLLETVIDYCEATVDVTIDSRLTIDLGLDSVQLLELGVAIEDAFDLPPGSLLDGGLTDETALSDILQLIRIASP